jgi:hypothetical protein
MKTIWAPVAECDSIYDVPGLNHTKMRTKNNNLVFGFKLNVIFRKICLYLKA